jgi:hypothetical protein
VYDDDDINPDGIRPVPREYGGVSWLKGWNFTSDLYRILEHAVERMRMRRNFVDPSPNGTVSALFQDKTGPSASEINGTVARLYSELPAEFRFAKAISGNLHQDRVGFQGETSQLHWW